MKPFFSLGGIHQRKEHKSGGGSVLRRACFISQVLYVDLSFVQFAWLIVCSKYVWLVQGPLKKWTEHSKLTMSWWVFSLVVQFYQIDGLFGAKTPGIFAETRYFLFKIYENTLLFISIHTLSSHILSQLSINFNLSSISSNPNINKCPFLRSFKSTF